MRITKKFTFDAGHRLSDYAGKCKNLHGHTYHLEVTIEGKLDDLGMVMDFSILKEIVKEEVDGKFDHKMILKAGDVLNEKIGEVYPSSICWVDYNPTAENIVKDIFNTLEIRFRTNGVNLFKIRLYETPDSYADTRGI